MNKLNILVQKDAEDNITGIAITNYITDKTNKMKKEEKEKVINYQPMGTSILCYPPKSESGIVLLSGSNVGLGVIVAKVGQDCTKIKVGDKVMFDAPIFLIEVDGETFWQLQSEHSVFGIVLNNGIVKQGTVDSFDPNNPTAHYNA